MTTVHNQKELKAAIRKGETKILAGNKRMEMALTILAKKPSSYTADIASKGVAGITPEMVVACGMALTITLVGVAVIIHNSKTVVVVHNPTNGQPVFTIEKEK